MNPYGNTPAHPYHLSVGALVLNAAGRLLVLRREDETLVLPTETIEEGETLLKALHRGLAEEAGVIARLERFAGSTQMRFEWQGRSYEKTVLWHQLRRLSQDDALRAREDTEASAQLLWLKPEEAAALFLAQGRTLGDWDFSGALGRLRG